MSSERFSLEGWEFWEWLKGNWKTVKEVGKAVVPGLLAWVQTQDPAVSGIVVVVGKFALDTLEYWIKKY